MILILSKKVILLTCSLMVGPYLFIFRIIVWLCLLLSLPNLHGSHWLRLQNRCLSSSFLPLLIISCLDTSVVVKEMRYVFIYSLSLACIKLMTVYTTMSVLVLTSNLVYLVWRQWHFTVRLFYRFFYQIISLLHNEVWELVVGSWLRYSALSI